ncbi:DUF2846 domain-containing protein [Flavobacteriaceae bacterium GSB9]|nr:DUF2846 domain-containing protein [Flavobacteriaceae bacterium GSB9]
MVDNSYNDDFYYLAHSSFHPQTALALKLLSEQQQLKTKKPVNNFAIIKFFRPKKLVASAIAANLLINGELVEKVKNGGYLEYVIYDFSEKAIEIKRGLGAEALQLIPEKGKEYYFKIEPKVGVFKGGFIIEQLTSPIPNSELKEKHYIKRTDKSVLD